MVGQIAVGIDTSNYTTSLCAVNAHGDLLFESRKVLAVPLGEHGLMQSSALFQHTVRLPAMLDDLQTALRGKTIATVGVSTRPRAATGSYMPVFHAGTLAAHSMVVGTGAKVVETTHQAGHIAAGIATASPSFIPDGPFLVLHLSGGTTDVLLADVNRIDFGVETVACSLDLHVGQFIDRIGVLLGLPFPAGKHLEELANAESGAEGAVESEYTIPSVVQAGHPSFSGPLSAAERLYHEGVAPSVIAALVQRSVANAIEKMIRFAWEKTGIIPVLLVGGVASNAAIRSRLCTRFGPVSQRLAFCDPRYASDNAFGVALIALQRQSGAQVDTNIPV